MGDEGGGVPRAYREGDYLIHQVGGPERLPGRAMPDLAFKK